MKNKYLWLGLLALASCNQEELAERPSTPEQLDGVIMYGENYNIAKASRSGFSIEGNKARFTWTSGDVVAVFPIETEHVDETELNEGAQVSFPITAETSNGNYAKFDGGGWGLRPDYSYVAYYPLKPEWGVDKKKMQVSYSGQVYRGTTVNGQGQTFVDFNGYDYMTAQAQKADDNGFLKFRFQHIGAMVILNFDMIEPGVLKEIEIVNNGNPFIESASIDLTQKLVSPDGEPLPLQIKPVSTVENFKVEVNSGTVVTTPEHLSARVYFMMPPTALKDQNLKLKYAYTTSGVSKTAELRIYFTENFEAGGGYSIQAQPNEPGHFYVKEPGTLSRVMDGKQPEDLTVTGNLNGDDFECIQGLGQKRILTVLNLEKVNIKAGGKNIQTVENALTQNMFSNSMNLTSLTLPTSVTTIAENTFSQAGAWSTGCTLKMDKSRLKEVETRKDGTVFFKGANWKCITDIEGETVLPGEGSGYDHPGESGQQDDGSLMSIQKKMKR